MPTSRFAPSTTGRAHPGTLLAALLCWLDARSRGAELLLRLEDIDPQRCTDERLQGLRDDLAWFGLDWDRVERQSDHAARHAAALDRLQASGLLYPCACSRSTLRGGRPAPDGGTAYPNTCRHRRLEGDWRTYEEPLRCRIPDGVVAVRDVGGDDLSQDVAAEMGDPIVRRRDGAVAYHLAVVVDDAAAGVTDVVRGRDLAAATATQVALQALLGLQTPRYRHHLLLLEERGGKLAKLHGAVGADELRRHYRSVELCGLLAAIAGLQDAPRPCGPRDLLPRFDWGRVASTDRILRWTGSELLPLPA